MTSVKTAAPVAIIVADPPEGWQPLVNLVVQSARSYTTKKSYARHAKQFFWWWDQQGRPPFTRAVVQRFVAALADEKYHATEINRKLTVLKRLAKEACYAHLLPGDELAGILDVKGVPSGSAALGRWLTKAEAEALIRRPALDTLRGKRDRVVLGLLLNCGLRRTEAAALRFENVQERDGRPVVVIKGKGNKMRVVPMSQWLLVDIQNWIDAAKITDGAILRRIVKSGKLLHEESLSSHAIWEIVKQYAHLCQLDGLKPHDLRRTYGREARKGGIPLDQISQTYGHSHVGVTQQYIGDVVDWQNAPCDQGAKP